MTDQYDILTTVIVHICRVNCLEESSVIKSVYFDLELFKSDTRDSLYFYSSLFINLVLT